VWRKIVQVVCGFIGHNWKFVEFVRSEKKINGWYTVVGERQRCSGCGMERIKKV